MSNSRRNFVKTAGFAATALAFAKPSFAFGKTDSLRPVCIFSKCLHFLDYEAMGRLVSQTGFDGVDLTVRPEGHVLPENVKTDLPRAVKILEKSGLKVPLIVTAISDETDENAEEILAVAAANGIERYRMNWFRYDAKKPVLENLDECRRKLERLEKLNRKYKIRGEYQNHSGAFGMVGGAVWDIYMMIKDIDPEYLGVQYDIMHASVEGIDVWEHGFDILRPWIGSLDIKDFVFQGKKSKVVPLGEGLVDYPKYTNLVNSLNSNAPLSIHFEYELGGAEKGIRNPEITVDEMAIHLKKDIRFVKTKFEM